MERTMRTHADLIVPPAGRRHRLAPVAGDRNPNGIPADELHWLQTVLGIDDRGPAQPAVHRARVVAGELRLLVPATGPALMASLSRPSDDHRLRHQALRAAGKAAAHLGLVGLVPGRRLTLPPFALVGHLAEVLGRPGLVAAVTLGPRRRNRKPVLQLLAADGAVVGYAKVGWSPLTTQLVDNEAGILRLIQGRLPAGLSAPTVLHHGPWRSGSVVVTSPLEVSAGRRRLAPRSRGATSGPVTGFGSADQSRQVEAGDRRRNTGEAAQVRQVETGTGTNAGSGAGGVDLPGLVRAVAACDTRPAPVAVAELGAVREWAAGGLGADVDLDRVLRRHAGVSLPAGLWHGDLTPWNLATGGDGTVIWDWELARPGRPVGFDLLHHRFEIHRRQPGGTSRSGLHQVLREAGPALQQLHPGQTPREQEAMVDLYLCELLARERLLSGQRWDGPLADLAPAAMDLLQQRLA